MAAPKAAWGIEIGADALKALRLEREGDDVRVTDFQVIPHTRPLTTPDLDVDEMIRVTLGQFISRTDLEGEHLVMSVPGHDAFARFAKLPPVEKKKIPDIVRFEAVQQIPFNIDEVEWDYMTFQAEDSPEIEVGIFAITRSDVRRRLDLYAELGLSPETLTLSPLALFNAVSFDQRLESRKEPLVIVDIGSEATDVVIAEEGRCWIRTFPLGGTHFTQAIQEAFKLSYAKAERLKKEGASSKYAKQIMQAMRPVFTDLLQDLQRSIGYYQSLHRDSELGRMVGVGSTFRIAGLRKFIGQQLQMDVERLDEYERISVGGRQASSFAENAVNLCTAYGLALQGVGLASIEANLVPTRVLREQVWARKTKWFAGAAAIFVIGAGTTLIHPLSGRSQLAPDAALAVADQAESTGQRWKREMQQAQQDSGSGFTAVNMTRLLEDRDIWPWLLADASTALAASDPQDELLGPDLEAARAIPVRQRRLVELRRLVADYVPPATPQEARRFQVRMDVGLSHRDPDVFLTETVVAKLREMAENPDPDAPIRIVPGTIEAVNRSLSEVIVEEDGTWEEPAPGEVTRPSAPTGGSGGGGPSPGSGEVNVPSAPGAPGLGGSGRRAPSGSPQAPPGLGGGGSTPGAPGLGGSGRRRPTGAPMAPPGSGVAGGPEPGAPGAVPGAGGSGGDRSRPGGSGEDSQDARAVGDLAPLPPRPSIYEPGDRLYRLPIIFEIEIVEDAPGARPVDAGTADAGDAGEPNDESEVGA